MQSEINGKLVSSLEEYKKVIANRHNKVWLKSTDREVYKVFGKPKRYPFVFIELAKDYEDSAYESTELVKVYF